MGMHKSGGTKNRGRTKGASNVASSAPPPTKGDRSRGEVTQVSRPIGRGGMGKNRGDRVDTNRTYAGSRERTPNFTDPRGSGRQQVQGGGKARKGGGKKQKGTYDRA